MMRLLSSSILISSNKTRGLSTGALEAITAAGMKLIEQMNASENKLFMDLPLLNKSNF
jgi:hypothetical protein